MATTGGAGHFAALVPFARALEASGHEVRVAAPASFAGSVLAAGLREERLDDTSPAALGAVFARLPSLSMLEANRVVVREVFAGLDAHAVLPGLRALVDRWQPDVIVREPAEFASYVVAEERGIPHVQVNAGPDRLLDSVLPAVDDLWDQLGCPSGPAGLLATPRWTLLPRSLDPPSQLFSEGPARFREAPAAGAEPAMPEWWGAPDAPLIYASFGSVAAGIGLFPHFYASVLDALADVPARVFMTLGRSADPAALGTTPPNSHVERWWSQDQVMAQAALTVNHGGFGTTLAALAAGVPQVVVPLFALDQFETASLLAEVGAGVVVPSRKDLKATAPSMTLPSPTLLDQLRQAVIAVLGDKVTIDKAATIAAEMATLPGCDACAAYLEQHAGRPPRNR
jgi:UDP:flavonoid glycosyltransferase YjiC (YdhE family)